jgi:hypothetical protein
MWKTRSRVWAQIGPFTYILPPKTADIYCSAVDFALFRKPYLANTSRSAAIRKLLNHQDEAEQLAVLLR